MGQAVERLVLLRVQKTEGQLLTKLATEASRFFSYMAAPVQIIGEFFESITLSFQVKLDTIKVGDACCTQKFLRSIRCGESQDIHTAAPGG